jgi:hypothetical protein
MKVLVDLDSAAPDRTREHWATRPSPDFKTGVRARARRRVRFPSASARSDQRFRLLSPEPGRSHLTGLKTGGVQGGLNQPFGSPTSGFDFRDRIPHDSQRGGKHSAANLLQTSAGREPSYGASGVYLW